jgi:hypothetical protein
VPVEGQRRSVIDGIAIQAGRGGPQTPRAGGKCCGEGCTADLGMLTQKQGQRIRPYTGNLKTLEKARQTRPVWGKLHKSQPRPLA